MKSQPHNMQALGSLPALFHCCPHSSALHTLTPFDLHHRVIVNKFTLANTPPPFLFPDQRRPYTSAAHGITPPAERTVGGLHHDGRMEHSRTAVTTQHTSAVCPSIPGKEARAPRHFLEANAMEGWRVLQHAGPSHDRAATCDTAPAQACHARMSTTSTDHWLCMHTRRARSCPVDWLMRSGPQALARLQ